MPIYAKNFVLHYLKACIVAKQHNGTTNADAQVCSLYKKLKKENSR